MKKVVSFCLYGCNATYIIGMKENIKLAKQYYSEWELRIYHNNSVPEKYINEYKELDAVCILCENIGENKLNWEGMFWRWFPLNDSSVDIWISRDADSRLSEREAKIVDEWIDSGKTLHCIRDHRCHFNYIMGGMFGINNKLFHEKYTFQTVSQIIKELSVYYKERPYNVDQIFLNDNLWKILKDDVMAHISKDGRRVYSTDILIPSAPDFIGKQYRLDDFPENLIKKLDKNKGCYWKQSTSPSVYWSNSSIHIKPDVKFHSEGEYFMHRAKHGFPQNWSSINILDGINIEEKPKEVERKIDINENNYTEFDKIIIIHLNKLKDRKENILKQINKLSNVVIIDAIDKDLLDINDLKEKNLIGYPGNDYCKNINKCWCAGRGHNDMMRTGRIACSWSHSLVYNYIISNDIQNALIFEDDFLLSDNFDIIIKDIKYNLPKDYDLIYFAHSKKNINNYTDHNKYFKKIFTGLSETVCYSITKNTAIKLLENLFPIRGAADGYIRQSIDYLKTIKNVYVCKNDLCKNLSLSIESNINTTIDINNKLEINNNLKLKNGCVNNYFNNKTSKSDILLVTGYWKIKNKYDSKKYSEWASNTLQLENDMCIFYKDRDFLDLCINIRKNKICKTYYIYRDIDDFYSNNIISDSINCTYNVVSIPLARVYSEKVKLLQIAKNRYNNYEWLGWIDIGNPIYRNNIPNQLVLTNLNILDKNKINCNNTHFNYNKDIILKLANNVYDIYYHYIAGSGYIINKNKINEFVKIFYDQQTIMTNYKNKINNSLILDDQCIWTQIYSKNPELFNIISGKYGEIYNTISQKYILYKQPYSYCGLGNQLLLLIYNLYSYKNNLIKFKLNRDLFNIDNLITKYICLHSNKDNKINECSKNIFNDNNLLDNNELQKVYIQCLKNLEIDTMNYHIYDTVIHIRSFYNNDDKYYYLQPTLLYYDYIFNNFNLGKDILLVYGLPKNPIVDIISKKYNIPIKTSSKVEDDLLIMKNCKNLIWDTSTLCWVASIMSTHNNHYIFGDYKKYIRSNTFVYSNNFINIKCNYDINRLSIKNMKLIDLFHTNNITNVSSNLKANIDNNVNVVVNNSPLVSIAISTFESGGKGHELLKYNIDQIFKQDYSNIEIIISDHSSDNKIKELCQVYDGKKYPIKYIHNPQHKGNSSQNTNNALKYCNGEYIKILFMDDYLYNESAITIIVENFEKNADKKWLVHSYKHTKDYKEFYNLHVPKFSHDIVFCNRIGTPSCLTIHNSVKERFDENLKWFMDSELYKRILDKYGEPIFLHTKEDIKPLMINLHHDGQVTNTSIDKQLINNEKIYITKNLIL